MSGTPSNDDGEGKTPREQFRAVDDGCGCVELREELSGNRTEPDAE